jgi:HEAT repeat protein
MIITSKKADNGQVQCKTTKFCYKKKMSKNKNLFCSSLFVSIIAISSGCRQETLQPLEPPDSDSVSISKSLAPLEAQAIQFVRESLLDNNPLVRTNAIEVVSVGRRTDLMPIVVALVNDDFTPVKFALALAVGKLRYYEGKKAVQKLLKDEDQNVRIAAAFAMTMLRDGNYISYLKEAIRSDDNKVRANAALLLGLLGKKDALDDLYRALRAEDSDDKVRFQAVESIAMLGDEKIYPKLWAMLLSAYVEDRLMGIRAMGALRTPQARNAIITMLDDELPEVRLVAAKQLGNLGQTEGEYEVLNYLKKPPTQDDPQTIERTNVLAAMAIGQIGTLRLVNFLPKLLKNESKTVRLAAAEAIFILMQ